MSNPIYSHDLYTPGGKDMLALLKQELVAIQSEIRATEAIARQLKKTLSDGKATPAQVVAAATQAEKIASQKRLLLARENAQAQRIHNTTLKQQAIHEQQVAAATSRANVARQREIDYTNRAATANKSHSSSLKGLIGSIRNLAYAYFSLGAATQIFQSILKQTKALDTLTVAFNTTLGSTQATAEAQEYLLDISERFGANLLGASQAYLKFSAASTQAGVSAEETQKIFTSVTKASSILGLGAERTSYVFLALEQIMSKGRLSTEELRRQLGEHLPGAFGIAAEAMGVTTAKLTDMLKKGEIASTDFLPKFAVQLEKAYGIDQVERIDNLAAAQERFNNELTLLVKELDLSGAFKDLFNALANGVRFVKENIDAFLALGKAILYVGFAWAAFKVGAAIQALGSLRKATIALTAAMATNPLGLLLAAIVLLLPKIQQLIRHMNGVSDTAYEMRDAIDAMNASFATEYQSITDSLKVFSDLNSTLAERQKAYNDINAAYPGILNNYDLEQRSVIDLTNAQEELRIAIIKRIAAEKESESYKKYFEDVQAASQFTPGFFSLYNKNSNGLGVGAEDIANARKKEAEIALADYKARGEIIKQTTLQMQLLRDAELEAIVKIEEAETRAIGRSFGQTKLTQQEKLNQAAKDEIIIREQLDKFNQKSLEAIATSNEGSILRRKIAAELLASKFPSKGGAGNPDDKAKKEKDPRVEALDRLIALNKLEEDSLDKKIAAVTLAYQKEKVIHENDTEYILALKEQFYRDLFQVETEFYQEEIEGYERSEEQKKAAFKKATEDVKAYLDDRRKAIEATENKRKANVDALRDEFSARRKHEEEIFDLSKHSEEEIADFKLKLKIDELNDEIQLHRIFGKVLSDEELARAIELRDKMQAALNLPNTAGLDNKDEETDIFSLLNINFDSPEQKEALIDALDFAKSQLTDFLDFQKEIIDQEIENADRKVAAAENNLQRQIALQAANQANNVAGAQAELALAKKTQEDALKQRQKFQKTELALNTALEASNLGVAIAKTLAAGLGIAGIGLVALMLGAFAAAKIKAFQLVNKKTFRKGGFREIGGGSHESGNDTHVGGNNWAEKDESVGIFTAKATRKYKPSLKAIVNAANKGTLENILVQDRRAIQGINMTNRLDIDTSLMEKRLTRLVSLSETKTFVDGRGRLVKIDRGRTTIINR